MSFPNFHPTRNSQTYSHSMLIKWMGQLFSPYFFLNRILFYSNNFLLCLSDKANKICNRIYVGAQKYPKGNTKAKFSHYNNHWKDFSVTRWWCWYHFRQRNRFYLCVLWLFKTFNLRLALPNSQKRQLQPLHHKHTGHSTAQLPQLSYCLCWMAGRGIKPQPNQQSGS